MDFEGRCLLVEVDAAMFAVERKPSSSMYVRSVHRGVPRHGMR